ncbi:PTS sugar transporter subunit IIA [Leucothrix arctica]|uniref:PTS sugar transporter subunit IIA n=1 Tax=Leucothrix arctica TaxID=1481894 RepID=A0A317CBG1_9GAMM|nr:PTS sugar transporter subunit IIA [Leucothrix arctica]PWQ95898.1 PTS sugar transporter subunit IIA [Leucothrix arctica]
MLSDISKLLSPERALFVQELESKKRVFDTLASLLSKKQTQLDKDTIFDSLIEREKLGSTTLGCGIAIPRARVPISKPYAALLVLKQGIDLETPDKKPVSVFLVLLLPESTPEYYSEMIANLMRKISSRPVAEELSEISEPQIAVNYLETLLLPEKAA